MKSIFLALALIATGVHAAEESDDNPCDAVENDIQTLECSAYSRTTAEDLLEDNYKSLTERMQTALRQEPVATGRHHRQDQGRPAAMAENPGRGLRRRSVPGDRGSKAFTIAQNDCVARMSDERSEFLESIGQE